MVALKFSIHSYPVHSARTANAKNTPRPKSRRRGLLVRDENLDDRYILAYRR